MKSIAAFKHLAVAGVASLMLCTGIGVANADNEFPGDKPIELVIHSSLRRWHRCDRADDVDPNPPRAEGRYVC